jgi:3-phenylpropionate/trans-cinnamate dioxygenase ferredoxin reductase subunit
MPASPVIVIGAGLAGASFVSELRGLGHQGEIILIGDEGRPPYDRPPLSKAYLLSGDAAPLALALPHLDHCEQILDDPAVEVDAAARRVTLKSGRRLDYATLVFATGAAAKPPPPLGLAAPVLSLRTQDDADALRARLLAGGHLGIIGGGIIGLEVAATARTLGLEVTVIEAADRLLSRNASPALARFLFEAHSGKGVTFHFGGMSAASGEEISLADGARLRPDTVLWATGANPNDGLARAAGIECDHGILVDELGRTSAAGVFAIGDVARLKSAAGGGPSRHETWTAARDHAANAARLLMDPSFRPDSTAFYFWTDQYEHKIHVIGAPMARENVIQTGKSPDSFAIYHVEDGILTGVSLVNNPRLLGPAKRAIARRPRVDPAQLSSPAFDLRAVLQPA